MIRKLNKRAAVEWYSWFLLFATMALLITALVAFVVKHGAVPYTSLGEAAIESQDMIFKREMQLRQIDAVVESSANIAARQMSYIFGVSDTENGYKFYNGAPILMIDGKILNIPELQSSFINKFTLQLNEVDKNAKDPGRSLFYFSTEIFYSMDYNTNTISLVDNRIIYGFGLKRKIIQKKVTDGYLTLKYYPDFRYEFQNYTFEEYPGILKNVSTLMQKMITENNCDYDVIQKNLNKHNDKSDIIKTDNLERYSIYTNNDCTKLLNTDYTFSDYYVSDLKAFKFTKPTKDDCKLFVCVQDNNRLLSGITHAGYFKIGSPIYRFALTNSFNAQQ